MTETLNVPGDFISIIKGLEMRIRILESTPRMRNLTVGGADGIQIAEVAASENRGVATWGDLATAGPAVNVKVSGVGVLEVILTARISVVADTGLNGDGLMGFRMTGPDGYVLEPSSERALRLSSGVPNQFALLAATRTVIVNGLVAGTYALQAKYLGSANVQTPQFSGRTLIAKPW